MALCLSSEHPHTTEALFSHTTNGNYTESGELWHTLIKRQQQQITADVAALGSATLAIESCVVLAHGQERGHASISILNDIDDEAAPEWNFFYSNRLCCRGGCTADGGCPCAVEAARVFDTDAYDMRGLLSDEELKYKGPIVECNAHCTCSSDCVNKACIRFYCNKFATVVQRGQTVNMHIKKTLSKGWALFNADTTIHRGQYIGTFAGELIDTEEADRRESDETYFNALNLGRDMDSNVSHVFGLDFWFLNRSLWHRHNDATARDANTRPSDDARDGAIARNVHNMNFCIDCSRIGNFTKFINHSCDPNLTVVGVYIDHSIDVPRITFFANRPIDPGEELCISYVDTPGKEEENSNIQYRECHCNSARCKGRLPI
ncbi:hypothetical protein EV122DRAFT_255720 [Schizophyllum commune]